MSETNRLSDEEKSDKSKRRKPSTLEPTIPLQDVSATDPVMSATLSIGSFGLSNDSTLTFYANGLVKRELFILQTFGLEPRIEFGWYTPSDSAQVLKKFNSFKTQLWPEVFLEENGLITHDGTQWKLEICRIGEKPRVHSGSNAYPPKWRSFKKLFGLY